MIARLAARGHSTAFKEDTANYIEFVRKWAGGTGGEHLQSLDLFVKGLQVHRDIPSEFYKQLASVPMASAPEYVIALVKASLSAPEKYIVNQKARLFTTQDLVRLTKDKRLEVQKAHAVMRQARVLLSSADVGEAQVSQCLGTLDVRLVMFVHEKKAAGRREFESTSHIGVAFWEELRAIAPEVAEKFGCPWHHVELASSASKARPALQPRVISAQHAQALGYAVGKRVKSKHTDEVFTISDFQPGIVKLQPDGKEGEENETKGDEVKRRRTMKGAETTGPQITIAVLCDEYVLDTEEQDAIDALSF